MVVSEVPDFRELACKRGELYAVTFEATELPYMFVQYKKSLVVAEANLEKSENRMAFTLGTGAISILQKEIGDLHCVLHATRLDALNENRAIVEVASTKVLLTSEVAGMQKKPKGQMMVDVLDSMVGEEGRE